MSYNGDLVIVFIVPFSVEVDCFVEVWSTLGHILFENLISTSTIATFFYRFPLNLLLDSSGCMDEKFTCCFEDPVLDIVGNPMFDKVEEAVLFAGSPNLLVEIGQGVCEPDYSWPMIRLPVSVLSYFFRNLLMGKMLPNSNGASIMVEPCLVDDEMMFVRKWVYRNLGTCSNLMESAIFGRHLL